MLQPGGKHQILDHKLGFMKPLGSVPTVSLLIRRIGRKKYWRVVRNEFCESNRPPDMSEKKTRVDKIRRERLLLQTMA